MGIMMAWMTKAAALFLLGLIIIGLGERCCATPKCVKDGSLLPLIYTRDAQLSLRSKNAYIAKSKPPLSTSDHNLSGRLHRGSGRAVIPSEAFTKEG